MLGLFDQCNLGAYLSAIELAFEGNLLLVAWAGIHKKLDDRLKASAESAEDFAKHTLLEESVAIRQLQRKIVFWGRARRSLWWFGLTISLVAVVFLYVLSWHVVPGQAFFEEVACGGWPKAMLMLAAYTGPTLMLLMMGAGLIGDRQVSPLKADLEDAVKKKEEKQALDMEKSGEAMKRLLNQRTTMRRRNTMR